MFDNRYRKYIQSFLLVLPMTAIVTAVNTLVSKGFAAVFTVGTLERWGISFLIAYPSLLLLLGPATKLTDRLIKKP